MVEETLRAGGYPTTRTASMRAARITGDLDPVVLNAVAWAINRPATKAEFVEVGGFCLVCWVYGLCCIL
jgi:hypothetical protein